MELWQDFVGNVYDAFQAGERAEKWRSEGAYEVVREEVRRQEYSRDSATRILVTIQMDSGSEQDENLRKGYELVERIKEGRLDVHEIQAFAKSISGTIRSSQKSAYSLDDSSIQSS
jgi:hypothetical protein